MRHSLSRIPSASRRRLTMRGAAVILLGAAAACGNLLDSPLPAGTVDPSTFRNQAGAIARQHDVVTASQLAFVRQMVAEGTITDELQDYDLGGFVTGSHPLDERLLPEETILRTQSSDFVYAGLQSIRGNASDGIGMLRKYGPNAPTALTGELFALAGYAEIGLADQYCSGVPLSTLDFEKDFTYKPGSKTSDVYAHAVALFDTAIALSADSAPILGLARVGRGRALLALGRLDDAAAAVTDVPDDFAYSFTVNWSPAALPDGTIQAALGRSTVADGEGTNGITFVTGGDPRSATINAGANRFGRPIYQPAKYQGLAPYVLASGIEARLIAAEAALKNGDAATWLAILNALRENAITPALADTTDPGTADAQVNLTFHERAMWLFLTGHRQGDLRRLVRQYGRRQADVFPVGSYPGGQGLYGTDVTVPIPPAERLNPLFTGCLNRDP